MLSGYCCHCRFTVNHFTHVANFIAKFVVSRCAFLKLGRNFGFFCPSIMLADLLGNTCLLVIGAFRSTFVSFCVSRFAACDRPVSHCFGQWSTSFLRSFLWSFLFLSLAMSASCPQQKFHSSLQFPSLLLSSLGSFSILFLQAKLGKCVALWFALTPPPLKWLTEQKNQFEVYKHPARYNEFGYKKGKSSMKNTPRALKLPSSLNPHFTAGPF